MRLRVFNIRKFYRASFDRFLNKADYWCNFGRRRGVPLFNAIVGDGRRTSKFRTGKFGLKKLEAESPVGLYFDVIVVGRQSDMSARVSGALRRSAAAPLYNVGRQAMPNFWLVSAVGRHLQ